MTLDEREWVAAGMAWISVRRWMHGAADGEEAWVWFMARIDARFHQLRRDPDCRGRSLTPAMARLEERLWGRVQQGTAEVVENGSTLPF